MSGNGSSVAIVEAIFAMAQRLDLDVVDQGVETIEQGAFLRTRACPKMQGFSFRTRCDQSNGLTSAMNKSGEV